MRHGLKIKKIGRNASHRKATLQSMSISLIAHKRITTTLGKARALRIFVEPILHRAKDTSTNSRRQAFRRLQSKDAVKTLYSEVASAIADRPGGYTRIVKLGQRDGDAAEMAIVEIVDFNDVKPEGSAQSKRRTRRSRSRSGSDEAGTTAALTPKASKAAATPAADDLARLFGIGPVFAAALGKAGLGSFDALAKADLETLRGIIDAGTESSDEAANEETWAEQARFAAAGDWDGLAAFVEQQKAAGGTAHAPAETGGAAADEEVAETPNPAPAADTTGAAPPEADATAEAVVADSPTPDTTGNPVISQTPDGPDHGDAEQGASTGTGEPPPEAGLEGQQGQR